MQSCLVVLHTAEPARREHWTRLAAGRRFDIGFTDAADAGRPKWPAIARWLTANRPAWQGRAALWLPDAGVETGAEAVEALFDAVARHGLWLAQPSLAWGGAFRHVIGLHNAAFTLRTTTFVDEALACVRGDFLAASLPTLQCVESGGHGLGWLWPASAPAGHCGVIDAVQVALHAAEPPPALPERPLLERLAALGVAELVQLSLGGVDHAGQHLSLADATRDAFLGRLLAGYADAVADPAALGATYLMHWQRAAAAAVPVAAAAAAPRPALRRSPIVAG